jgi:hypothetical protein
MELVTSAAKPRGHNPATARFLAAVTLVLLLLFCHPAHSQQSPVPDAPRPAPSATLSGSIIDRNGAAIVGARIQIAHDGQPPVQELLSSDDGQFCFSNFPPGTYQLTISSPGFATQTISAVLSPGQSLTLPATTLSLSIETTEVHVEFSTIELAQEQLKDQEKQRVLGVIPNFYVTYDPKAVPLSTKQKFQLAWKTTIDPVTFGLNGAIAGIEQAQDRFSGYGQGADGYAKRYAASYADLVTSNFIGGAILPSLFKQDPRYFYKGTGSIHSRVLYAVANAVICKGDNGHWQPNYSGILGSLAAGGISNLYYPASDRGDVALTFENTLIGIGASAGANVIQEFLLRKLTPNLPTYEPATP